MVFIKTDVMKPENRQIITEASYNTIGDFLDVEYPDGFGKPTKIYVNNKLTTTNDTLKPNDIIVLLTHPNLPVGLIGGWFVTALANAAIAMALQWISNKLFGPEEIDFEECKQPSAVYNLNGGSNSSKIGSVIPVTYGTVRMYPAAVCAPYVKYIDNIQYVYQYLMLGQGTMSVDKLYIEKQDLASNLVEYKVLNKHHWNNLADSAFGGNDVIKVLATPQNIPLDATKEGNTIKNAQIINLNNESGIQYIEVDLLFPRGIYRINNNGDYINAHVTFTIAIVLNGRTTKYSYDEVHADPTPLRKSYRITIPTGSKVTRVQITKTTDTNFHNNSKRPSNITVIRVKLLYKNKVRDYGDTTILAIRLKATNAISGGAANKINVITTRKDVPNDMKSVLLDMYTNKIYGARLSASDCDFNIGTAAKVNGSFDNARTLFDQMMMVTKAQGYHIFPTGLKLILKKDEPSSVTVGHFNEDNIVKNSMSVDFFFDEEVEPNDGIETEYREKDTWDIKKEIYPSSSIYPKKFNLFGVTSKPISQKMAKYIYKSDKARRIRITFDSDIEGATLQFLDKITVVYKHLKWDNPREFIVESVKQRGDKYKVACINYDGGIYA